MKEHTKASISNPKHNSQYGKWFLNSLITSIAIASLLGIMALLSQEFGEVQLKVLLSTLCVSGASLCGLASAVSLEKNHFRILGWAGVVLSLVGAAGIVCGIWVEVSAESFWKVFGIAWMWGVACSHASLLCLARLTAQYQWAKYAGMISALLLVAILSACVIDESFDGEIWRVIGILSILVAGFSICVPIFHYLCRTSLNQESPEDINREIQLLQQRLKGLETRKLQLENQAIGDR